jgi:hypothetical protein
MGWKTLMLLVVVLAGIGSTYAYDWHWRSGAEVWYDHDHSIYADVIDSGTINVGDTVTRDYPVNSTLGGAHLVMKCYEYGNYTVVEATVSVDPNCDFSGCLKIGTDDDSGFFGVLCWAGSYTQYLIIGHGWSDTLPPLPTPTTSTKTPIPPLATILVLMAIPAIALRKITK